MLFRRNASSQEKPVSARFPKNSLHRNLAAFAMVALVFASCATATYREISEAEDIRGMEVLERLNYADGTMTIENYTDIVNNFKNQKFKNRYQAAMGVINAIIRDASKIRRETSQYQRKIDMALKWRRYPKSYLDFAAKRKTSLELAIRYYLVAQTLCSAHGKSGDSKRGHATRMIVICQSEIKKATRVEQQIELNEKRAFAKHQKDLRDIAEGIRQARARQKAREEEAKKKGNRGSASAPTGDGPAYPKPPSYGKPSYFGNSFIWGDKVKKKCQTYRRQSGRPDSTPLTIYADSEPLPGCKDSLPIFG